MNFSEFKRLLGAEPLSRDPEFLDARRSGGEFEAAAAEADIFEDRLQQSLLFSPPVGLVADLKALSAKPAKSRQGQRWWPAALAASVLLAVGAAGLNWNLNRGWDSVPEYVVDHYRHDGDRVLNLSRPNDPGEVQALLTELNVQAAPALAGIVGLIKNCPTPDGRGLHMILNTENGPATVIYMPDTVVNDQETLAFDDVQVVLVRLQRGSAAIIAPDRQLVTRLHDMIQESIVPIPGKS
ncbi:MAG: DUF3379 family protein [Xanthomonadales bacterium]|nr:DUF3379 domain-containing protein [Gammaproteobacteria bacterium]MBT8053019.1 DUF3379 domain-containing protein [Gammaproteobacteria bacterium]NND57911.1 DUF3379 family protein [Xanthomonadales bacterium]